MTAKQTAGRIALALSLMCTGTAFAAGADDAAQFQSFAQIMAMKMMDKNSDGMVSKKEYMDMMGKAWEMNAKKMGVKGDNMTSEQYVQFLRYLQAGAGG